MFSQLLTFQYTHCYCHTYLIITVILTVILLLCFMLSSTHYCCHTFFSIYLSVIKNNKHCNSHTFFFFFLRKSPWLVHNNYEKVNFSLQKVFQPTYRTISHLFNTFQTYMICMLTLSYCIFNFLSKTDTTHSVIQFNRMIINLPFFWNLFTIFRHINCNCHSIPVLYSCAMCPLWRYI